MALNLNDAQLAQVQLQLAMGSMGTTTPLTFALAGQEHLRMHGHVATGGSCLQLAQTAVPLHLAALPMGAMSTMPTMHAPVQLHAARPTRPTRPRAGGIIAALSGHANAHAADQPHVQQAPGRLPVVVASEQQLQEFLLAHGATLAMPTISSDAMTMAQHQDATSPVLSKLDATQSSLHLLAGAASYRVVDKGTASFERPSSFNSNQSTNGSFSGGSRTLGKHPRLNMLEADAYALMDSAPPIKMHRQAPQPAHRPASPVTHAIDATNAPKLTPSRSPPASCAPTTDATVLTTATAPCTSSEHVHAEAGMAAAEQMLPAGGTAALDNGGGVTQPHSGMQHQLQEPQASAGEAYMDVRDRQYMHLQGAELDLVEPSGFRPAACEYPEVLDQEAPSCEATPEPEDEDSEDRTYSRDCGNVNATRARARGNAVQASRHRNAAAASARDASPTITAGAAAAAAAKPRAGGTGWKRDREKNRQAQQRFRERQKLLIVGLKEEVETLHSKVSKAMKHISRLEVENFTLKVKLEAWQSCQVNAAMAINR